MQLDFNPKKGIFSLRVPRGEKSVHLLMHEHGLDLSLPASTAREAVLFTAEPYAAVAFSDCATPRAREALAPLAQTIAASWADDDGGHYRVPADRELWPFQRAAVRYALDRKNTLLGDEPGLGKTEEAIVLCNEWGSRKNLVVCPASIRLQWAQRIREWSTLDWRSTIYPILSARNGVHPTAEWTIVSYDLARSQAIHKALAMAGPYETVILDEAHYLKTPESKRTRACFGDPTPGALAALCSGTQHILTLSGTPMPNRPRECFTLARHQCWDAIDWMSEHAFQHRFNPSFRGAIERNGVTQFVEDERVGRLPELQARLRANFMTRHLKREVMPQLQMPIYDLIRVEETKAVKAALAAESLLAIDPDQLDNPDFKLLGQIATVRREMGIALAPQVAEYVDVLIEGGEDKLVVFAWHTEVLNILERAFVKHGVVRVDGNTSAKGKTRAVETFQAVQKCKIIIGNILSLGTGTDGLQKVCNHALIAEPDWTPGNNVQAFDRLDRGGQTRQVQGEIFVAPKSLAEKILVSALRKAKDIHTSLDKRVSRS